MNLEEWYSFLGEVEDIRSEMNRTEEKQAREALRERLKAAVQLLAFGEMGEVKVSLRDGCE